MIQNQSEIISLVVLPAEEDLKVVCEGSKKRKLQKQIKNVSKSHFLNG